MSAKRPASRRAAAAALAMLCALLAGSAQAAAPPCPWSGFACVFWPWWWAINGDDYPASCAVDVAAPAFGIYDPADALPTTTTGSLSVECERDAQVAVPVNVTFGTGAGSYANRYMDSGGDQLDYNLYANAAYTQILGDGTGGTVMMSFNVPLTGPGPFPSYATGSATRIIYGRVPASQGAGPGSYVDSIDVTVEF